jgi:hypothetical protein
MIASFEDKIAQTVSVQEQAIKDVTDKLQEFENSNKYIIEQIMQRINGTESHMKENFSDVRLLYKEIKELAV